MRAYYLVIFVLPLTVFTAMAAREIWGRVWGKAVIMAVIFYSVIYTYNSNLVSRAQAYRFNDYGHGAVATLATNWRHWEYSYSAAGFSPELGWKTLKQKLDRAYRPGDCLTLDQPGLDLPVRHYLRTHDLVRQALLGKQYLPAYPMCEDLVEIPGRKIRVYYNSDGKIGFQ